MILCNSHRRKKRKDEHHSQQQGYGCPVPVFPGNGIYLFFDLFLIVMRREPSYGQQHTGGCEDKQYSQQMKVMQGDIQYKITGDVGNNKKYDPRLCSAGRYFPGNETNKYNGEDRYAKHPGKLLQVGIE